MNIEMNIPQQLLDKYPKAELVALLKRKLPATHPEMTEIEHLVPAIIHEISRFYKIDISYKPTLVNTDNSILWSRIF